LSFNKKLKLPSVYKKKENLESNSTLDSSKWGPSHNDILKTIKSLKGLINDL
jgi:hypothetical protein